MLQLFRELEESGQELIVTDNNRPVLRIVPIAQMRTVSEVFGQWQGQLLINEELNTPTADEWRES